MPIDDLLVIMDDRVGSASRIITLQVPIDVWHAYTGNLSFADVIMEWLVHTWHRLELKGDSLRKRKADENTQKLRVEDADRAGQCEHRGCLCNSGSAKITVRLAKVDRNMKM
jgi:hypothetical protein